MVAGAGLAHDIAGEEGQVFLLEDLYELASVTTATVARIERDEIEPRMTTRRKLAQALKMDPAELIE